MLKRSLVQLLLCRDVTGGLDAREWFQVWFGGCQFSTDVRVFAVDRYGCGNSVHIKCMKVWAGHQLLSTSQTTIECPFCRANFGPMTSLEAEFRGAAQMAMRRAEHPAVVCHECHATPIIGKCYKWVTETGETCHTPYRSLGAVLISFP